MATQMSGERYVLNPAIQRELSLTVERRLADWGLMLIAEHAKTAPRRILIHSAYCTCIIPSRHTGLRLARMGGSRKPALTVDQCFIGNTDAILLEPAASKL